MWRAIASRPSGQDSSALVANECRMLSVAAKKGAILAGEKEPAVRLRYGRFDPRFSFRSQFVPVGRYRCRWPANSRSTWAAPRWGLREDHWPLTVIPFEASLSSRPSRAPMPSGRVLNQPPPGSPSECLVALRQLRHCLAARRNRWGRSHDSRSAALESRKIFRRIFRGLSWSPLNRHRPLAVWSPLVPP
jgi:hypothetical protein